MLKLTISEFFKRLTLNIWTRSHELMLRAIRWFLLITFFAVIVADLAECQPVTHYWQVTPDPGPKCRQGYAQLLTMGTVNVVTDILLVVFPIPIIIRSKMGMKRKLQLVTLFAGSLLPAGTTLYRIPNIINRDGSQQYRSLLASVEILFATAIANALVLGSFVRDRGLKKQRWKFGSMSDSIERTTSRRGTAIQQWGSDEDLVRDLGLSLDPTLRLPTSQTPRPAPMAVAGNIPVKRGLDPSWQFPGERSDTSDDIDLVKIKVDSDIEAQSPHEVFTPRKVSFFDVGGLLEEDNHKSNSSDHYPNSNNNYPPNRDRRISSTRTTDTDGESSMQGAHSLSLSPTQSPSHSRLSWSNPTHTHSNRNSYLDPQPPFTGLSPPPPRRGSTALLQDIGGLLAVRGSRGQSRSGRGGRESGEGRGGSGAGGNYELQNILHEHPPPSPAHASPRSNRPGFSRQSTELSLQDVGGLLR